MSTANQPPIPAQLSHLPVIAGLAVPWVTPHLPDGRYLFGVLDEDRRVACLTGNRCQVCSRPLSNPVVLLLREQDLERRLTAEPAAHPWCAAYTQRSCPMVAGRMSHYRSSAVDLRGSAEHAADMPQRLGAPADAWYAVWLRRYDVVTDPLTDRLAASFVHLETLKVREISRPQRTAAAVDADQVARQLAALMALFDGPIPGDTDDDA